MTSNWKKRIEAKIGNMGEEIVRELFENNGWFLYKPETGGPHPFDKLAIGNNDDEIMIIEVKTKARRGRYPDTGIEMKHYSKYMKISKKHNLNVFLVFVDSLEGRVYGNYLNLLNEKEGVYPKIEGSIIYFPLSKMITLGHIPEWLCEHLFNMSNRDYNYNM